VLVTLLILIVLGLAGMAYASLGFYNVAATYPDPRPVARFLGGVMDASVERHAAGIHVPPLNDPNMVRLGFQHYRGMCVERHAAPGVSAEELAKGLNPKPPKLARSLRDWQPGRMFWITEYGVRMTGMPAWGPTHSDNEIWAIVAFLDRVTKMSPADYRKMDREVPALREG
jgi:mono/diheme cytochrome c family protein